MRRIKVGLLGSSGYMSGEIVRVLYGHPFVDLVWSASRQPFDFFKVNPNLIPTNLRAISYEDIDFEVDVVVSALPAAQTIKMAERFLAQGIKFIDLGPAFRLKNITEWERLYGMKHLNPELAEEAVYGVNEINTEKIIKSRLVANPGCFSSAMILGLAPALEHDLVKNDQTFHIGLSGTAGMGAALSRIGHHPEIGDNAVVYNATGHRHTNEVEEIYAQLSSNKNKVHFTPVYIPITRGIVMISNFELNKRVTREELLDIYEERYKHHPFIIIQREIASEGNEWNYANFPWVKSTSGTNYAFIGIEIDAIRNRAVVVTVLDSLGKGGAHVAVENINLMFGLERTAGINNLAIHP